jgi:hypothetical protein
MKEKKMIKENFRIVRVVTKDIVTDAFQGIRNLFGLRLRGYERMLSKYIEEAMIEMDLKYKVDWFRLIVNPLGNNSAMIVLYGKGERNE